MNIVDVAPARTRRLPHDGDNHDVVPGTVTHIGVGERVSLTDVGPDPVELIVVAAPPDFAAAVSAWPTA